MNVLLNDPQGILSEGQKRFAEDRLYFSLARFGHKVNHASLRLSLDDKCEFVTCEVDVSVEGVGRISTSKTSISSQDALSLAADAIEPKVARQIDWRMWVNAETLATWMQSARQPLNWLFGLDRSVARWPTETVSAPLNRVHQMRRPAQRAPLRIASSRAGTFAR
jgi:hypothetical protein